MDLVVPLSNHSKDQDRELIFALRSACKYIEHDHLIIIGSEPQASLSKYKFIAHPDRIGAENKALNIHNKILSACYEGGISDNFILMSDDHYLTREFCGENQFDGMIAGKLANFLSPDIRYQIFNNTLAELNMRGTSTRLYDLHAPFIINKHQYIEISKSVDWSRRYGYALKSLYQNIVGESGEPYRDLKVKIRASHPSQYEKLIGGRKWFSIGEESTCPAMFQFLEYLYPEKCKYELLP